MVFEIERDIGSTIIFLLSAGSNPTPAVEEAAKRQKKFKFGFLGTRKRRVCEIYIAQSTAKGECVLLQNCHLGLC
jgi:hypothetical protein